MQTRNHSCLLAVSLAIVVSLLSTMVHGQGGPIDPNNRPPVFDSPTKTILIPENFNVSAGNPVNDGVGDEIEAEDIENDPIEYYILSTGLGADTFTVETSNSTGQYRAILYIKPDVILDREVDSTLQVAVYARDGINHGVGDEFVIVTVQLLDVNDNPPVFQNFQNSIDVPEDKDPGQTLVTVMATDADSGKNAFIDFSIANVVPSGNFIITITGGSVILNMMLDFEVQKQYVLTIVATDLGTTPMSAEAELTIFVTDVNDNPPVFTQNLYVTNILENMTMGASVITIPAEDGDEGIDDDIIFSFNSTVPEIDGVPSFAINSSTGEITVNSASLDRENISSYSLIVKATEAGDSSMTSEVTVEITVVDVNDNGPRFTPTVYNHSTSEQTGLGTDLVTLTASDMDVGVNAEFQFHFVNLLSNNSLPFNISSTKVGDVVQGTISLAETLDYETIQMYRFLVIATEVATVERRTAFATVEISVINTNDMDPVFEQMSYSGNVSEAAPEDEFVLLVKAVDKDLGTYGTVRYSLLNTSSPFSINESTGVIRTTSALDHEMQQSYTLTVVARDSPAPGDTEPTNSAQVTVEISVLDVNDNAPIISVNGSNTVFTVHVSIGEMQEPGQLVYVVVADDRDSSPYNILTYNISSIIPSSNPPQFAFSEDEPNQLVTTESLDYEEYESYALLVVVSDGMFSDSLVVAVEVLDSNDNSPKFNATVYNFELDENLQNGTSVGVVEALDRDNSLFGTVRYSISGVNSADFFINDTSGEIFTSISLDADGPKQLYTLTVTATDQDPNSPRSGTATVVISVRDLNDNEPIFSPAVYVVTDIFENETTISIPLQASDADSGINAMIGYTIIGGNHNMTFVIDSNGVIGRNPPVFLDREPFPEFDLTVLAQDMGTPRLNSTARVIIRLQDVNDNTPVFSSTFFNTSIPENVMIGTTVTQLVAEDPDFGSNSEIRYTLTSMNSIPFMIDQDTGVITTTELFDYDQSGQREFNMQIRATDNGANPRSSVTTLEVAILDVNDNAPIFSMSTYTKSIPENLAANSSIQQVTATDEDSGENSELTYQIVDTTILPNSLLNDLDSSAINTTGLFSISTDGTLSLSSGRNFDRESVTGYSVQIRATDGGMPSQSGTATVHVSISDINDNYPQFSQSGYNFTISESASIGTTITILTGTVTDIDAGTNAEYTFSLSGTSYFSINPSTGVLSLTIAELDYDNVAGRQLMFNATATNKGSPALSTTVEILVFVTDANDNSPQFPTTPYSETVSVDEANYTKNGQQLLTTLVADDIDSGEFGKVNYSISDGNIGSVFWINSSSGGLYVTGYLDRETTDSYTLTVTASDGGTPARTAIATIDVTVLDINESPPSFGANSYSASISENSGAGVSLVQVSATDPDLGNNGTVTFSITGTYAGLLSIGNVSGIISTNDDYNYETMENFTVTVVAADNGNPIRRSMLSMTVFITDENDNKPVFTPSIYSPITLPENMAIDQSVAQVNADDADSGQNAAITYTLANGQGRFFIHSNGTISLVSSLDRENVDLYQLVITATDNGQMRLSSSAFLNVTVSDINDNAPQFNATLYQTEVSENSMVDDLVLSIFARDADINNNAVIDFEITNGDPYKLFKIEKVSSGNGYLGRLLIANKVDYENETSFQLTITASDQGIVMMSRSVQVIIDIMNTNDNQPIFALSPYVFFISENVAGAPVGTIVATDADSAPFGTIVSYTFAAGTDQSVTSNFTILTTGTVGELRVIGMLDHEKQPIYTFNIVATDSGMVSMSVPVTVNVTNVNEGAPQFGAPFYMGNVTENRAADEFVIMVVATEMDNAQSITYSLVGDYGDLFNVDAMTGRVTTKKPLNREQQSSYILRIRAMDNGSPPLSSIVQVTVEVLDENDNSPEFPSGAYSYPLAENTPTNTVVIDDVTASDDDSGTNSQIAYSLSGGNGVFSIDISNGHITLVSSLNRETDANYTLNVTATDMGTPESRSAYQLLTVIVVDSNDNPPVFSPPFYTVSIPENTDEGELVVQVFATDNDIGDNAAITFSLAAIEGVPFAESPFTVSSDGNVLTNNFNLDWETRNFYQFTIRATDGGSPPMTATAEVNVTVLDLNDNPPMFPTQPYSKVTPENNVGPNGNVTTVLLLRVMAQDIDMAGPNSTVRYSIDGDDYGIFSIDPPTGDLFAVGLLDFESQQTYTLTVVAMDSPTDTTKTLSSSTNVTIILTDVNDNKPVFQNNPYFASTNHYVGNVLEDAPVGTTVLMVYALDDDTGANGEVTYRFLSGEGGMFSINETTGFITVSGSLNTETHPEVNLTVIARDGGNPIQLQNADVTIKITGINDNIPTFPSSFYTNTISEGVSIGTVVRDLNAIDQDSGDSLVYSILTNNSNFTINPTSGEIIVDMSLDREFMEIIDLLIQVSDGNNTATTTVQITLTDVNDNPPVFREMKYFTNITENTQAGAAVLVNNPMGGVTRIEATDADKQGTPNNLVTYKFIGTNSDVLNIDPSSAIVTVGLGANLNFEADKELDIIVEAYDRNGASGSLTSTVILTVYIEDENDVAPSFDQSDYSVNLVENSPDGTSVAMVSANDPDTGLGGVVNYFIIGADPLLAFENFEISSTNGTVYVTDSIDREMMEQVTLTITARDSSTPFLSSTTTLSITITDVNDNAPKFSSQHYFISVPENLTVGEKVFEVSATDDDTSNNAVIDYNILNLNDVFNMDQVDGVLATLVHLDHETNSTYEALIQACDRGSPKRCSNATVVIAVTDVNDETPIFDYDSFCVDVCSTTANATVFAQLVASDADSGNNGLVRYFISAGDTTLFSINQENGKISLANTLPAGTTMYSITVEGVDSGSPPRSSVTTLQVNIKDCSSGLMFSEPFYTPTVEENTTVPAIIPTMISVAGGVGPVTYTQLSTTEYQPFNLSSDGVLTVIETLDKEKKDMYSLNIQATDGVTTTCAIVTVTVLNVNDNPPQFLLAPYFFSIDENRQNEVIGSTLAIDPDQPGTGGILYRIQSQTLCPVNSFSIGQMNGSIIAVQPLDREEMSQCVLIIEASDQDDADPRTATAVVTIIVNDVNDNRPMFDMDSYEKSVSESMPPDSIIVRVEADDDDQGSNAQITYSIVSGGDNTFRIDPNSGTITTTATLDFETTKFYNLTVLARDNGMPSQNNTVPVVITIEDYNDCTPQFAENVNNFQKEVFENAVVGTVIIDLNSTDCDSGQNGNVTYSIIGGNDGRFFLDPITGVLSIGLSLDYEDIASPTYNLDVRALDNGSPPLFSIAQITVTVVDFNDQTPVFSPNFYMFTVSEAIEIGNNPVVGQVSATDGDSSTNGDIQYAITEGNTGNVFSIDETSGVILVVNSLNREFINEYTLFLTATDKGSPALSANATVNITVLDANDNNPTITNINSTTVATVLEGALGDTVVFTVNAVDPDEGTNAIIDFSLSTLGVQDVFMIVETDGTIFVKPNANIDYEETTSYTLTIVASDRGASPRMTSKELIVRVIDRNDNPPLFDASIYTGEISENAVNVDILTLRATDQDGPGVNSAIQYTIITKDETRFTILNMNNSGILMNTQPFDREMVSGVNLTVQASNAGADPPLNTTVDVTITVLDINDNKPSFTSQIYTEMITENSATPAEILSLVATDIDQPMTPNSELTYSIIGTENIPFAFNDSSSGQLILTSALNREQRSFYSFDVEVEDQGTPRQSGTATIEVTVLDVNDNPPVFTVPNGYRITISEGNLPSAPYLLTTADYNDPDMGINRESVFSIVSVSNETRPLEDMTLVTVDNSTIGEVWLNRPLDYETTKNLTILLAVNNTAPGFTDTCNGCTLWSQTTITVTVRDVNDNPPMFTRSRFNGQVSTAVPTASRILQITANDKDSGNFGTIRYRLLPGSSSKFSIEEGTGFVLTRGTFANDDGQLYTLNVEAYDNLGASISLSSTATVELLVLKDFRRVLIIFDCPINEITVDKEQIVVDVLQNVTGFQVVVEERREHVLDNGDVNPNKTDFIFHAIQRTTGEIVDFDTFILRGNEDQIFSALIRNLRNCTPERITSLENFVPQPAWDTTMIIITIICILLSIGAIVLMIMACQQRYLALHDKRKQLLADVFYGGGSVSLAEGMPRDFSDMEMQMKSLNHQNEIYVEPYNTWTGLDGSGVPSTGDLSSVHQDNPLYEEQEIRMEMFNEGSDEDTEGDMDEARLLAAALQDEDEEEDGSVTAI